MTGQVLAIAHWRRLNGQGRDTCRLVRADQGFMLVGHARFVQDRVDVALDYVVRCDTGWHSTGGDVTGTFGTRTVGWRFVRDDGWSVNGVQVPAAATCVDIDLGFTPATNLLPLRRLKNGPGTSRVVPAVWLRWPDGQVGVLEQIYRRRSAGIVEYRAPGFDADLAVHPSGFVTDYPGGWEGTVDAP